MTIVIGASGAATCVDRLRPEDAGGVVAMYARCSPDSRYRRWHGHSAVFPKGYLRELVAAGDGHLPVVAYHDDAVVGFASAAKVGERVREIGLLVEDAWQHQGIGGQLLTALVDEARREGSTQLRAEVMLDDAALLAPLRALGPVRATPSHGVITATVDIAAS